MWKSKTELQWLENGFMKGHHVHSPLCEVMVSSVMHNVGRYCIYTGGQFDSFFYVLEISVKKWPVGCDSLPPETNFPVNGRISPIWQEYWRQDKQVQE